MKFSSVFLCVFFAIALNAFPVIIDTDIGQDIDDSWALALALKSPNMELKLVLSANNNTRGRAQIIAKYLTTVGRDDIPIGIGFQTDNGVGPLYGWAQDFDLSKYKGPLYEDGVHQMINIISNSAQTVTILAIAPVTNLLKLIQLRPDLVSKVRVVAMSGSYKVCYGGGKGPCPEYNVVANTPAAQAVYSAKWIGPMQTDPTDIGWNAVIGGSLYQRLLAPDNDIICSTMIQNYVYWRAHGGYNDPKVSSTVLWDPIACFMVFTNNNNATQINYETVTMSVNDAGDTVVDPNGQPILVGASWLPGGELNWMTVLVDKLTSK